MTIFKIHSHHDLLIINTAIVFAYKLNYLGIQITKDCLGLHSKNYVKEKTENVNTYVFTFSGINTFVTINQEALLRANALATLPYST